MSAPILTLVSWYPSGTDPSGVRFSNLVSSGFDKIVSLSPTGILDYGSLNNTSSGTFSNTKVLFARLMSFGDATEKISDMKFWYPDVSAFNNGTYSFYMSPTGLWAQNVTINDTFPSVPTTLPTAQNLFRSDNGPNLSGLTENLGCSQYIRLVVKIGQDVTAKTYGSAGWTGRITFSYN